MYPMPKSATSYGFMTIQLWFRHYERTTNKQVVQSSLPTAMTSIPTQQQSQTLALSSPNSSCNINTNPNSKPNPMAHNAKSRPKLNPKPKPNLAATSAPPSTLTKP